MKPHTCVLAAFLACFSLQSNAEVGGDCSWDKTGHDPYTGSTYTAVMGFKDMDYRSRLALNMLIQWGKPTDVVSIGQYAITGSKDYVYSPILKDMHFGKNRKCATVSRAGWSPTHIEVADAYRVGNYCALKPKVCGNLSWTYCHLSPTAGLNGKNTNKTPEPGTIGLVLLAIGLMAFISHRGKP